MVRAVVAAGAVALLAAVGGVGAVGVVGVGSGPGRAPDPGERRGAVVAAADAPAPPNDAPRTADGAPGTADGAPWRAAMTFRAPLDGPVTVSRPFRAPAHRWAAGHRGVDLAARPGRPVLAPEAGVVTFAGTVVDRGVVTVTHAGGLRSTLEPVDPSVRPGRVVLRGAVVGTVAGTPGHCAPAACLHWGLRRGDTYLDPLRWVLDRGPVVLLPTG